MSDLENYLEGWQYIAPALDGGYGQNTQILAYEKCREGETCPFIISVSNNVNYVADGTAYHEVTVTATGIFADHCLLSYKAIYSENSTDWINVTMTNNGNGTFSGDMGLDNVRPDITVQWKVTAYDSSGHISQPVVGSLITTWLIE